MGSVEVETLIEIKIQVAVIVANNLARQKDVEEIQNYYLSLIFMLCSINISLILITPFSTTLFYDVLNHTAQKGQRISPNG